MEDVSNIGDIQQGGWTEDLIDKYNGTKVKIVRFVPDKDGNTVHTENSQWKDNKKLPEGQTIVVKNVYLETAPLGVDAAGQSLVVKEKIGLKQDKITGRWGWSTHDKAKNVRLKKLLKCNKIDEVIGREIVVVKTVINNKPKLVFSIPA